MVRDKNGSVLAGATVTATPGEFSTDITGPDGTYSIVLPNGTYRVAASKPGYLTSTNPDVVVENGVATVDFTLGAALCGTVPDFPHGSIGLASACGLLFLLPIATIRALRRHIKRRSFFTPQ